MAAAGAGQGSGQTTAPAKSIEGTYSVLSATFGGKTKDGIEKAEFVFKGGTVSIREGGKEKEESAKYKIDATKTPGHIDITPKNEKVVLGIFETKATKEGVQLTLAFTKDGGERPTDFKGDAPGVVVLKLMQKKE